jgi:hypothetical protein
MNVVRTIRLVACLVALTVSGEVLTGAQKTPSNGLQFIAGPTDGPQLAIAAAKGKPNAGRPESLHASQPLPLYTLESDALAAGKGLATARACGFQYLIESADAGFVGSVDVHVNPDCAATMTGLNAGDFGRKIRQALLALAIDEHVMAGRYEPRMIYANLSLVNSGARNLVAVWLKSLRKGEDLIYLLEYPMLRTHTLEKATGLLNRLRPRLVNVQWSSDHDLHAFYVDRFLESEGNGITRVVQIPMAIQESMRLRITSRDTYKLDSLDLIGVGKHPDPVAFLGRSHRTVWTQRETRPLSAFEKRAIAELTAGEDVAVESDYNGRLVVGALRAQEDCLKCHGAKTGDVLGALVYRLTPAAALNSIGRVEPPVSLIRLAEE